MGYSRWMEKVDQEVSRLSGVSAYELADYCFIDAYEDGLEPHDAAMEALINDGCW